MTKKVTMLELAKIARVDISTVSRALNDSPVVKESTRRRIQRIASEIGYVVNAPASSLRRKSARAIGMVIPLNPDADQTMSDPFYLEMVGAVSQAAAEIDYDLVVTVPRETSQLAERRLLNTGRADGIIVIGQADRAAQLNELSTLHSNFVVWGARMKGAKYTTVGSDNAKGGYLAASHLLARGARRILFLGDPGLPEVKLRHEGFLKAHREAGVSHDASYLLRMNFGGHTTYDQVIDFLRAGSKIDGIFASSDLLANSAMHALVAEGLSVPGDVRVVGYDNIGQSAMMTPPLTTVTQNIAEGGRLLVKLLLAKLDGEKVSSRFTETELIVRNSA
ncbi:substrate-binding domain-containing protein [Hyphomonas sp.]|uniref:substrate-binding domain-containing protein n=1 Tax=Hyphomonas sp. TaxID=87 RepID=UPI003919B797